MKKLSNQLIDKINKNFSRINILLNRYLKNPDEKNIHGIRKSIRRGESAYATLPKKYRKKKNIRDYIDQSKKFFKINSQIRDYDIYLEKIEKYRKINKNTVTSITSSSKNTRNNINNDIISTIQNYRKSDLKNATIAAEKLKTLQYLQIKKNNKKVQKKIDSRFRKVTKKFSKKIQKNLQIVIDDETKVEELHSLRKDCKQLRYILELKYKKKNDKNQDNDPHTKSIMKLEDLQDSLGQIHDCDAILSFFEKLENYSETKPLMNIESEARKDLYRKFVNNYRNLIQQDIIFIS